MAKRIFSSKVWKVLCSVSAVLALPAWAVQTVNVEKRISFARDVAPILSQKCIQCHGQPALMANLDLGTREGAFKGGQHGPVIVPGNAAGSHLYRHLTGQEQPQMPLGGRLSSDEIATFRDWIDSGAEWDSTVALAASTGAAHVKAPEEKFTEQQRRYWAFQKVVKPPAPTARGREWSRNPIDAFVLSKLEGKHLKPNSRADKITLIRRAYLDLIGLPPTTEDVQVFLADESVRAFEKVV